VPETWQELLDTTEQAATSDEEGALGAPWCIGIESSGATGWPATDWIEDLMLRLHGPEVYDQWVQHEILFDSPEVRAAFEEMEKIWFNDNYVLGGTTNILQTPWASSVLPMFEDPAGCLFHRQASFVSQSFPEDAEYGTDYDFTLLPRITEENNGTGQVAALTAGDLAALYTDNDEARQFIEYMGNAEAQELWAQAGSYLCPNANCSPDVYPNDAFRRQAELVSEADYSRFDGSDLMPGAVGAGAFWTEVVAWISGQQDLDATLQNIDAAWPESAE
jgi:alpha-glucoside transport system substrate-binding protein